MKKFLLIVCFAISCFFVYTLNTHAAAIVDARFVGYSLNSFWSISPNSSITGKTYFVFPYGTSPNYIYADICSTGYAPNAWVTENFDGSETQPDTTVYELDKPCNVNGYSANVYRMIFSITKLADAGDGNTAVHFTTRLFNNTSYSTPMRLLNLGATESYPIDEATYYQNKATNDKLDSVKGEQEKTNQKLDKTNEKLDKTNQELGNLNDSLNDDNTSAASNTASEFFSGFDTDTFGLTSIITAPLNLIGSITSSSCSPLGLEVPFVDSTLNLPCMTSIYEEYFGGFLTVYQTITFGIIAYWVCVRIFALVKDFKNPDHDEIEVMDL